MTTLDTGSAGSFSELFTRSGLLIIDASSLRDQLYVADFDFFSEVIDLRHMESPDEVIQSDSYEAALTNYAQSVTAFDSFDSFDEIKDAFDTPELLVETDIPPTSIREILLCKEVLGRGWFSSHPALPAGEQQ